MWTWIVEFQRGIYLEFAEHMRSVAGGGGWTAFLAFLPMGVVFGSVHAMTPGHSKALLAAYVAGSPASLKKALLTSWALSFTHVGISVLIVLLSLPLVQVMFGGNGPGSSPVLEGFSRGLLCVIGVWIFWRALRRNEHHLHHKEGVVVGMTAGLIPCPLTLFIMNFAVLHQAVATGLLFALTMMAGVGLTLAAVAAAAVLFRERVAALLAANPLLLQRISRGVEALTGLVLAAVAAIELVR